MNALDVKTVMPGHGQIGTRDLIVQMKNYLVDLKTSASNLIQNDQSIEEVDITFIPDQYKEWWFDRFYIWNLEFAYASLQSAELE